MKDKIMEKVLPIANSISNNQFLVSLRDGFMVAFPATMFASIAMIIQNFPQTFRFDGLLPQAVLDFLNNFFGPVGNATINVTSIFVVFGIAYTLGKKLKCNPLYSGAISLAAFLMLLPFKVVSDVTYMPLPKLGAQGMFVGIITAFIATEIFAYLENKNITIKMPDQIPQGIANSFTSIIPGAATLLVFNIIRYIFTFTKWGNAFDCLFTILQRPLTNLGSSLPATIIAVILAQLLWWFGVHGQAVVNSVMDPIWNTLAIENYAAYSAGAHIPHIVCSTFMGIFPLIGGNGMTPGIILVALFIARSVRLKSTMKMVVAPAFFNISEPVTFGLPIVLNPTILIPWVLAPVVTVMNRNITEAYSPYLAKIGKPQGECFHRYILGVYSLYEKITQKYPELMIEGCAAGGGRFDLGILYYSPQIWTSDDSDAVERLKIQFGTTLAYPVHTLSNHVSEIPNFQVGRKTPLNTRGDVAFFGNFGYEMDLVHSSKEELGAMKEQIREYKKIREMISDSNFYHISSPFDGNETIWALESKDQEMIMLGFYRTLASPNETPTQYICLPFADENGTYTNLEDGAVYNGSVLKEKGLRKPAQFNGANAATAKLHGDYQSKIFYLKKNH